MYDNEDEVTLEDAVATGVAFLNSIDPSWPKLIDLEEFDIAMPDSCVIGQTFCHMLFRDRAVELTGISGAHTAWTMGITVLDAATGLIPSQAGFDSSGEVGYNELNEAWTEYIKEHQ